MTPPVRLLLTFCNQLDSPDLAGLVLSWPPESGRWLPSVPSAANGSFGGLCGIVLAAKHLYAATQSTPAYVLQYDASTLALTGSAPIPCGADLHSMVLRDGGLYIVSTGTNALCFVPLVGDSFGEPKVSWQYPGVSANSDDVHLNGLTADGDGLIATCFGPRTPEGKWGEDGSMFRVETMEPFLTGLKQPHSPVVDGDRMAVAESGRGLVHTFTRAAGQWVHHRAIDIGGYVRGLSFNGDTLFVGISAERQISRSSGVVNAGVATSSSASIAKVDVSRGQVVERFPVQGLGREIYDLMLAQPEFECVSHRTLMADRISAMQTAADRTRVELTAARARIGKFDEIGMQMTEEYDSKLAATAAEAERLRVSSHSARELQESLNNSRAWKVLVLMRQVLGRPPFPSLQRDR